MRPVRADYTDFPEYAGQYRLESVLGSGGMGVVHLATSESGLKLAVKIVHAQHAVDPEFRARFRQEVAAARRVSGAFTAPVVDADPDAERPWMATLFIDAPTLAERVREGVLEAKELARLAAGLAEALRDIHRAGVVHRDLKPSNVLMAPDGVRVIDFGISRPADSDLRTETGKLIGTPPFMAPEQFQRPREVGSAADVFALGAVLVHAATGRGPFDSDSHYLVAYQVVHSEPDLTGLPERLVPLVARCLAKDPAERPSADALIAALRAVAYPTDEDTHAFIPRPRRPVVDEVITHRREQAPVDAGDRGRQRRPVLLVAGLGLLLTIGAAGGYLAFGSASPPAARVTSKETGAPVPPAEGIAPWSVALGERSASCSWDSAALYCAGPGLSAARIAPADGSVLWAVRHPAPSTRTATDSPLLHSAGLVLAMTPGSELLRALDPRSGAEHWKRKLPNGTHVVAAGAQVLLVAPNGNVTGLDAANGSPRWTKQIGGPGSTWWHTSEGSGQGLLYVATPDTTGRSTRVTAVDPLNGTERRQVRTAGRLWPVGTAQGRVYLLDTDAEGRTVAVVRVDLTTRGVQRVLLAPPLYETQAAVGPDGTVYVFGATGALVAVGPAKEQWRLETGVALASRPVFADGKVYLSASDGRLLAVDAGSGRLLGQTKPRISAGKSTFAASLPAPVVGGGRVYASAPDGTVFAVAAGDPAGW
ncbi:PQQ-binding-like beta-propeller repeat protein [Streptomyces sp. H27-H1]|uniref:serine/threonine-protein kinase n=1 Tax=Streptomyces sp. H27-H1 TaxID=2996461 RepID=UPI00226F73D9|nr:PQQ-binding-like beta-propeller repeat protein [Streptomyces sp. H27-H1]MCY0927143.1 PQQ-binding-like beta-propeller repeat protein [Streptomyces sp. H27-H1]